MVMINENNIIGTKKERVISPEKRAQIFETALQDGVVAALAVVKERFENASNMMDNLSFHNVHHTEGVIRRFDLIMNTLKDIDPLYTERGHKVGRFAAANHDTVQRWEPNTVVGQGQDEGGLTKTMRKRFVGANETASLKEALAFLEKVNKEAGTEIFTDSDLKMVEEAINVTVPGFDMEKGTVVQPSLTPESSLITRAVALADISTAGIDGPEAYLAEGDALFREENLDIAEAVKSVETLSEQQKNFYRERMLKWGAGQIKFAEGRKSLLEDELLVHYPDSTHEVLRTLFGRYDDSIAAEHERTERRKAMNFEELAEDMGFALEFSERLINE